MKMSTSSHLCQSYGQSSHLAQCERELMHLIILFCLSLITGEIKHLKMLIAFFFSFCEFSIHIFPWFTVEMLIIFILRNPYI